MLVCLACPKQTHLPPTHDDHHHHSTLAKFPPPIITKEHFKSFTTQLKDIVMKFSTGAYRHCRPCTAQGGTAVHDQNEDDEKSSILVASNSEDQAFSLHQRLAAVSPTNSEDQAFSLHQRLAAVSPTNSEDQAFSLHQRLAVSPTHVHQFGNFSPSRYLLPTARKRHHRHKKSKRSSNHSNNLLNNGLINDINPSLFNISTPPTPSSTRRKLIKQLSCHLDPPDLSRQLLNDQVISSEQLLEEQLMSREQISDGQLFRREKLPDEQLIRKKQHPDRHDQDHDHENNSKIGEAGKYEEWVAQVEPGVMITFVALPDGCNHLKRIRFSQELFSKWQAQLWWAENSDMVHELYSVTRSEAPGRDSPRSPSSTSSSLQEDALRNTPEILSRVGSSQSSPSRTSLPTPAFSAETLDLLLPSDNARFSPKSGACTASASQLPVICATEGRFAQVDYHENHDYEDELGLGCSGLGYIDDQGMISPLMRHSPEAVQEEFMWASGDEALGVYVNLQQQQQQGNDDDHNALGGGVREPKEVGIVGYRAGSQSPRDHLLS